MPRTSEIRNNKSSEMVIPFIIDIIENEKELLVFREYIEGKSLEEVLEENGAQSEENVIEWAKELCSMLMYLHTRIPAHIYRDMKPANVILTMDNHVKVIDFGIVRMYDPKKSMDTCALGTKGYAAPEQYGGSRQTDVRTDIFGLGMTLHHLVTGVDPKLPPYDVKPIREINPSLSKGLEYIISKCTEPDPDKRYQNCMELLRDLEDYKDLPKSKGLFEKTFWEKIKRK